MEYEEPLFDLVVGGRSAVELGLHLGEPKEEFLVELLEELAD